MKIFNLNGDDWDRVEEREGWRSKDAWVGAYIGAAYWFTSSTSFDATIGLMGTEVYDANRDNFSRDRLRVADELRHAIADGHLELWYQPQIEAATQNKSHNPTLDSNTPVSPVETIRDRTGISL